jgi:hypothetical protein
LLTVPEAGLAAQIWFDGWVLTDTAYAVPEASPVLVSPGTVPSLVTVASGAATPPKLPASTSVPVSPVTVVVTAYVAAQVTAMLLGAALPMVPVPFATAQFWIGLVGCVFTVIAYAVPLG